MSRDWKWRKIGDLSFAVYDVNTGDIEAFDPSGDQMISAGPLWIGDAEKAVTILFEEVLNYTVRDIDHKRKAPLRYALGLTETNKTHKNQFASPDWIKAELQDRIKQHDLADSKNCILDKIDIDGIPDLLIYSEECGMGFQFVEVKKPPENLLKSQIEWIHQFDFLPIKIACVFENSSDRDQFVSKNSLEDLIDKNRKKDENDQKDSRPKLPSSEIASQIASVEIGDQILFNDRKQPLIVIDTDATSSGSGGKMTGIEVRSSRGNRYILSEKGDYYRRAWRRSLWWFKVLDK